MIVLTSSDICAAVVAASEAAGVIANVEHQEDAVILEGANAASKLCDAIIVSGSPDADRKGLLLAAASAAPTLFIADADDVDDAESERAALQAGAHAAILAENCTPHGLRSALQNAMSSFSLQQRMQESESRLERAVQTVVASRRDRLAFLNHVGHEFRTPLNAVIGFADVLAQRTEVPGALVDDTIQEYLNHIRASGGDMLALIEDLMLLAHSDSLAATVLQPMTIQDVIDHVYPAVQEAAPESLLTRDEAVDPTVIVRCDIAMFAQTIRALTREAAAYGPTDIGLFVKCAGDSVEIGIACPKGWVDPKSGISQAGPWPYAANMNRDLSLALALAESVAVLHGGKLVLVNTVEKDVVAGMSLPVELN